MARRATGLMRAPTGLMWGHGLMSSPNGPVGLRLSPPNGPIGPRPDVSPATA